MTVADAGHRPAALLALLADKRRLAAVKRDLPGILLAFLLDCAG